MDKLQVQSTAFLLTKELPTELIEQLQRHKYNDITDLVNKLVDEELESWQYCYIWQYRPDDQSIPEYIVQSIETEQIISHAEELVNLETPLIKEDTPFTRDPQVVEGAGGREEYCEVQIDLYKQVCAKSLQKKLTTLLNEYSDELIKEEDVFDIGKELAEEVGIWRCYILRNNTEQGSPSSEYENDQVCEWIIAEATSDLLDIIDAHSISESIDLNELSKEISSYSIYDESL